MSVCICFRFKVGHGERPDATSDKDHTIIDDGQCLPAGTFDNTAGGLQDRD